YMRSRNGVPHQQSAAVTKICRHNSRQQFGIRRLAEWGCIPITAPKKTEENESAAACDRSFRSRIFFSRKQIKFRLIRLSQGLGRLGGESSLIINCPRRGRKLVPERHH